MIHAIVLLFADQRPHLGIAIERGPSLIFFAFSAIASTKFLVDRFLHQDAAAGGADFALVDEDAEQRSIDGRFEVRIGKKDVRRLAAEFERHAFYGIGGLFDDDFARPRRFR